MRALGVDEGSELEQRAYRLLFSCERITHQLLPLYVMEGFVSRAGGAATAGEMGWRWQEV